MGAGIDWVINSCRLLTRIGDEFEASQPFAGIRIGTAIHMEPKTVALILTLQRGGADLVAMGNLGSTQPDAADYLRQRGVTVVGQPTTDLNEHDGYLRELLATQPDVLLDNGGDLFVRYLENPYEHLRGGTEETTSGRNRLLPLRSQLNRPVLVINDSPIKQFAENYHAVGLSVLESYLRITNRTPNGERVTVYGYGPCGKGIAVNFRNAFAKVTVCEIDPVKRLEAHLDGFAVVASDEAAASADVIITSTGATHVITADDLPHLRDGVIVINAGHFPDEIDVAGIASSPGTVSATTSDGITTYTTTAGRRVHVLAGGHMVNLNGPRPLGNSIESMDLGFALQSKCLEAVARGTVTAADVVVPVPRWIDDYVSDAYLASRG